MHANWNGCVAQQFAAFCPVVSWGNKVAPIFSCALWQWLSKSSATFGMLSLLWFFCSSDNRCSRVHWVLSMLADCRWALHDTILNVPFVWHCIPAGLISECTRSKRAFCTFVYRNCDISCLPEQGVKVLLFGIAQSWHFLFKVLHLQAANQFSYCHSNFSETQISRVRWPAVKFSPLLTCNLQENVFFIKAVWGVFQTWLFRMPNFPNFQLAV